MSSEREIPVDAFNPLGLDGIEFVEYSTNRPQAFGQVLETMGFRPIARHRSREVLLFRQGEMNIIVNSHVSALPRSAPQCPAVPRRSSGQPSRRSVFVFATRDRRTSVRSTRAHGRCPRASKS